MSLVLSINYYSVVECVFPVNPGFLTDSRSHAHVRHPIMWSELTASTTAVRVAGILEQLEKGYCEILLFLDLFI